MLGNVADVYNVICMCAATRTRFQIPQKTHTYGGKRTHDTNISADTGMFSTNLLSLRSLQLRNTQELLEFTQGLDFSKYIRDAEVQSMIDQVKKRITEMEEQPEVDETMEDDDKDRPLDEADARLEVRLGVTPS